jgi:hypothetical protein
VSKTLLKTGSAGDTAIIIDGIALYRWLNPNAAANRLAWSTQALSKTALQTGPLPTCGLMSSLCRESAHYKVSIASSFLALTSQARPIIRRAEIPYQFGSNSYHARP